MIESKKNNFDLLRLFAAAQVAILHMTTHLKTPFPEALITFLDWFPGVPIFFSISGFLIAMSFERSQSIKQYAWNRFLRIYPALWVCFIFTLIVVTILGFFPGIVPVNTLAWWIFFQISGYTIGLHIMYLALFPGFGVGEVNGSLWTIPIELQFYVVIVALLSLKWVKYRKWILAISFLVSVILHQYLMQKFAAKQSDLKLVFLQFTIFAHLFSFLLGTFIYLNFSKIKFLLEGKLLYWFIFYVAIRLSYIALGFVNYYDVESNPLLQLLYNTVLVLTCMSFAFSFKDLSHRLLNGNDISYGFYIYHMVVVNIFITLGYTGQVFYTVTVFATSVLLAFISWRFVEKKALKLKELIKH